MEQVRRLMGSTDFGGAAAATHQGAAPAYRDGDRRTWRRLVGQKASVLYNLGRFADAVDLCDEVVESAGVDDDLSALAHAWNISSIAADRISREDTLDRLDGALTVGERLRRSVELTEEAGDTGRAADGATRPARPARHES